MYNITLRLYIVSFNLSLLEQCFISEDQNQFSPLQTDIQENDFSSIEQILQKLFEKHVELGFGWTSTKLLDVEKNNDTIYITYATSIPAGTALKNCYYTSKNISIVDRLARKALNYV